MAVSHSPAKIAPSPYITGTTAPVAITAACSPVPPASAQPCPGRPTSPAITSAATPSTPPITPACAGLAWAIVMATGMASQITTTSKTRTVAHSLRTSLWPPSRALGLARGAEQQAGLARRGRGPGDQDPRAAQAAGGLVGQRGAGVDRI